MPNQQETMMVNGMVEDLKSEKNAPHVATLGLTSYVDELATVNSRYAELTSQRTSQRNAEKTADSATLRKEMDPLYDYITTVAFCESVAKPTQATARFISELNAVIDEINALYNQRMGLTKKTNEETPLPPPTDTPADPETPDTGGNDNTGGGNDTPTPPDTGGGDDYYDENGELAG